MDALALKIRSVDVFDTKDLIDVIDTFTRSLSSHLNNISSNPSSDPSVNPTSDIMTSDPESFASGNVHAFTAICTEVFVSLRSHIQYLSDPHIEFHTKSEEDSEFMLYEDNQASSSISAAMADELLIKLWSPLLQFVKSYPTADRILSTHASTLTRSVLDSLAHYLAPLGTESVLSLSSSSVASVNWSVVFPLVSRLGCIMVFWHQTIDADTLTALYSVLSFFKGYVTLLQSALTTAESQQHDPELQSLVSKFEGVYAKIHTKSNISSTMRLHSLRRYASEYLLCGSHAFSSMCTVGASALSLVSPPVQYSFQLVGLLMWSLCEISTCEIFPPSADLASTQLSLETYLAFLNLWVRALGAYCCLGSTLMTDAWVFDLLDTVARDVVGRMRSLAAIEASVSSIKPTSSTTSSSLSLQGHPHLLSQSVCGDSQSSSQHSFQSHSSSMTSNIGYQCTVLVSAYIIFIYFSNFHCFNMSHV